MLTSRWQGVFALPLRFQFFQSIFRITLTLLAKGSLTAVDQPPIPAIGTPVRSPYRLLQGLSGRFWRYLDRVNDPSKSQGRVVSQQAAQTLGGKLIVGWDGAVQLSLRRNFLCRKLAIPSPGLGDYALLIS